ncbi:MAG: efflux RND transporter periplasmic adaptor subunit, partial [Acidobacteriota bacterium]
SLITQTSRTMTKDLVIGITYSVRALVVIALLMPYGVLANGGDDHGAGGAETNAAAAPAATVVTAERNIQNESGSFSFILKRSPGDPRSGETELFVVRIGEKVEGGFGGGGPVPVEKAKVSARITKADGTLVAADLAVDVGSEGNYRTSYSFGAAGDYKIVLEVTTEDGRNVSADFPVSVASGPFRTSFWLGLLVLILVTLGSLGLVFYSVRKKSSEGGFEYKKVVPLSIAAIIIFTIGLIALIFLLPPQELRAAAEIPAIGATDTVTDSTASKTLLTVSKESQILFGIKTEPIAMRIITGGLKVSGVVKARPDSQAVVVPPVAGRVLLREGLTLGSAVGKGQQIGFVEQVLDVSGQVGLETQRLEVAAREREVEAQRLELRNTVLQLQAQQSEQRSKAQQARTQLAQAQREQRRAENLVEVGAAPKKRLEEAVTAVKVVEQEVIAADRQSDLIENQIKQTQAGQKIFVSPRVNQPTKTFPLIAPTTGIINEIKVTSGQQVDVGTQLVSIVNLSTVLIEAQVFERDLPIVRESTRASFTNAALSGEVYTIGTKDGDGRLLSIGQVVNEQTRTVPLLYEMKNPLGRLKDGMFVDVTIDTTGNREALAVPKQAVITEQGQTFVFVFEGGETFEKRPVALVAEGSDFYEVKTGLKEGERVVTEGIYQLRSTQPST